jgi:hypothetical protein
MTNFSRRAHGCVVLMTLILAVILTTSCGGEEGGMSEAAAQRFWAPREEAANLQKPDPLYIYIPDFEESERWEGQSADELKSLDTCAALTPGGDTEAAYTCWLYKDFYKGMEADGFPPDSGARRLMATQEEKVYEANNRVLASFDADQGDYLEGLAKITFPEVEESSNPIGDTPESEWAAGLCPRGGYEYFITPDSASSKQGGFLVLRNREGLIDTTTGVRIFSCDNAQASLGDPMTLEEATKASPGIAAWIRDSRRVPGFGVTGLELERPQ